MDYQHDIFISYKRHPETLRWIRRHFLPLLDHRVGLEWGKDPRIYVHEITSQIPAGTAWPVELGEKLGTSRILIALWSKPYLNSVWCAQELCVMLAREQEAGCRTPQNKYGLIVPVIVHDGDNLPHELSIAQRLHIQDFYDTRMRRDGSKAERLSESIAAHARGIAAAIENAPQWQENWSQQAAEQLFDTYYAAAEASQRTVPRFYQQ